jgi:hypothetical protein
MHSTTLNDGSVIADWRIRKSKPGTPDTREADEEGGYVIPMLVDNAVPIRSSPTPSHYLRLTFGPDGKLTGWRKYSQYYQP